MLRKLQQLSLSEWWLLAQAQTLLALTLCAVRVLGVSRWQSVLTQLARSRKTHVAGSHQTVNDSRKTATIARMVNIAAHHGVFRANCLQRSLVLWCLLRRSGIESEIRFGARKNEGELEGHAWVECDGVVLNESQDTYLGFLSLERIKVEAS